MKRKPFALLFQVLATVVVGLGLGSSHPLVAQDADAGLESFFKAYLEQCFRFRPLEATRLGDHRFDHLLDDLSVPARSAWLDHYRQTLKALPKRVDRRKLSASGQLHYDIFRDDLVRSIWLGENTRPYETDARLYNEYINESVFLLLTQSSLPKETNISNAIARIGQIPRVVAAAQANLRHPPRVFVETASKQNRGAIGFYENEILQIVGETPQLGALRAAAGPAVESLKQHQLFLEKELLPRADGDWRLGRRKFYRKMEMELNAGLTADQVIRDAQVEFVRVQTEMRVIARQLWSRYFPKAPLPPDDASGLRMTVARVLERVGQEHNAPEQLVQDIQGIVARLKQFISEQDILRLPDPDRCRVIEMPEFQRGNYTGYMNPAPPLDPTADSVCAISPPPKDWDAAKVKSYLEEYNRHMLQIWTIHEAYPGHYVQLEYSNRDPSLIGRVLQAGPFMEGWAVYSEQTMLDQGYGEGDLALRLTQLKFYLRAVANAILDHQMHCTDMTDDEAVRFLMEGAYQSEGEARLKVIRSKQSSCQLSTYFVGRMAFYRLRQQIQHEQGNRFDLGRYHEAVLSHGSVPIKYLPGLVRERLQQPR